MRRTLLLLFAALTLAQDTPNPWASSDIVEPAALAAELQAAKRPVVVSVAFPVLYRNRHILSALDANAGSKPEGIEALKKLLADSPKDADIVIYCGCCPMDKCPNVRPAFKALKQLGYSRVRVLNIPTNMSTDWYAKNYPSEPGAATARP